MSDQEANGIRARLAIVDQDIEKATAELKAATGKHWEHYREHELYEALRRRDVLAARLAGIDKTRKNK